MDVVVALNTKLQWGTHAGKTLRQVAVTDPEYLEILKHSDGRTPDPNVMSTGNSGDFRARVDLVRGWLRKQREQQQQDGLEWPEEGE